MKKLFLAICFSFAAAVSLEAKVEEVLDIANVPQPQQSTAQEQTTIHQVTADELGEYLRERIDRTVIQDSDRLSTQSIFVEPSPEAEAALKERQKSAFEKIYDNAMQRVNAGTAEEVRPDMNSYSFETSSVRAEQQRIWNQPDFPTINVLLPPNDRRAVVPAEEHIPYLMTQIEILPDGLIKFDETVVVIANGGKLRKGLTKILPGYIYSRSGDKQKLDYTLLKVTVNGQEVPYRLQAQKEQVLLIPEKDYRLEPGVYTYHFQYVNDRLLWDYGEFKEFYWDVTGSAWNLVIGSAGAMITTPPGTAPLGQQAFVGYPGRLSAEVVDIIQPSANTWGYAAKTPLFIGEGLHLILSLPAEAITPPSLGKRLISLFDHHGDLIISLMALTAVWTAFLLSWKYIRRGKGQLKVSLRKNAVLLRYLAFEKFDFLSLAAFLLELYRKNIIDIQQSDDTVLLIKRTDRLQTLSAAERKALEALFSGSDAVFNVTKANKLKLRRAADILEKELHQKLRRYMLKLNSGYLFFSLGMLVLANLFIALLQLNWLTVWSVALIGLAGMAAGIRLYSLKSPKLWKNILIKIGSLVLIGAAFTVSAAVIHPAAAAIQLAALGVINYYTAAYSHRNGLLRDQIAETEQLRQHLQQHRENILLGREIVSQQANILALDLAEAFMTPEPVGEYNKLAAIKTMMQKLNG